MASAMTSNRRNSSRVVGICIIKCLFKKFQAHDFLLLRVNSSFKQSAVRADAARPIRKLADGICARECYPLCWESSTGNRNPHRRSRRRHRRSQTEDRAQNDRKSMRTSLERKRRSSSINSSESIRTSNLTASARRQNPFLVI